ncbi:hypothetical protein ZIOFF_037024 [Zingiber officinale]|uniref:3-beta hydroxysteroid dehydrogenase/isomerase domain-containing protein n=1 Tax=Zingiber officinale TaxID=94328 RepID=A0A8J5GP03_ZINOF|nr:hypothetical protein ZIOFF_037024 [Zingiber officinale]
MGVLRSTVSLEAEIEEMRAALQRSGESAEAAARKAGPGGFRLRVHGGENGGDERMVCVTGGISFVGFAIVNRLLDRGYTVRLALETQGSAPLPGPKPPILDIPISSLDQLYFRKLASFANGFLSIVPDREIPDCDPFLLLLLRGAAQGFALRFGDRADGSGMALFLAQDLDKLRETEMFGEMGRDGVWAVIANVMDLESLCHAFDGCTGVFHTSSVVDPAGLSGYTRSLSDLLLVMSSRGPSREVPLTDERDLILPFNSISMELYTLIFHCACIILQKHMADIEVRAAELVIEACVRTQSVKRCVFTSSLLACVWRVNTTLQNRRYPTIVDENCWSDQSVCCDKKLWYALGKMMAEKAAWRAARGRDVKLVTVCPALVIGPGFHQRNATSSIAYLKGALDLFREGLLATVNVEKVAEAHVSVYDGMSSTACGRYICYDRVIRRGEEAAELERQLGLPNRIPRDAQADNLTWFELSNRKLSRLLSSRRRCTYDTYLLSQD